MSHKSRTHASVHKRKSMKRNLHILARAIGSTLQKRVFFSMFQHVSDQARRKAMLENTFARANAKLN